MAFIVTFVRNISPGDDLCGHVFDVEVVGRKTSQHTGESLSPWSIWTENFISLSPNSLRCVKFSLGPKLAASFRVVLKLSDVI